MLFAVGCSTSSEPSSQPPDVSIQIIDVDKVPEFVPNDEHSQRLWNSTKQVYALRQFRPAWSEQEEIPSTAEAALQTLENAPAEGLHPEDFAVTELRTMHNALASADPGRTKEFDRRLTYALVRYVSQLCFGRVDPRSVNPDWPATEKNCDIARFVHDALEQSTVDKLAEQLSPKIPEYQGLKASLKRYRDIAAQGGSEPALAARLALMGDLTEPSTGEVPSSKVLNEALRQFQSRHGLESDGRLGPKTLAALNVPADQRIEQIEINMDRMRWIAHRLEPHHIRVNVPGFELAVHEGDQVPLQMRAIVGSTEDPTPVLDSAIRYLVFSPYWNIPLSIATKELLPEIKKDTRYLRRENIEVVRGSGTRLKLLIRQRSIGTRSRTLITNSGRNPESPMPWAS